MNYIKYLEGEVKELEAKIDAANRHLSELKVYLQSPKFYTDTTVQVQDVQNRLQPLHMELMR